jgi:hypothetical protein
MLDSARRGSVAHADEPEPQQLEVAQGQPIIVVIPEKGVRAEITPERIVLRYGHSTVKLDDQGMAVTSSRPVAIHSPNIEVTPGGDMLLRTGGTLRLEAGDIELATDGEVDLAARQLNWLATGAPTLYSSGGLSIDTGSGDLIVDADDILFEAQELNADIGYEMEIDAGMHFRLDASSDIVTEASTTEIRGYDVYLAGGRTPVARVGSEVAIDGDEGEVVDGSRKVFVP